jgi:hypothetical protein
VMRRTNARYPQYRLKPFMLAQRSGNIARSELHVSDK